MTSKKSNWLFATFLEGATRTFAWGMVSTTLIGGFMLFLGWWLGGSTAFTWVISVTGYVLGIPLGMLVSPHKNEGRNFRTLGGYLVTFFSGFVVSKLANLDLVAIIAGSIGNPVRVGRFFLFVAFFGLAVVQTYIFRVYRDPARELGLVNPEPK